MEEISFSQLAAHFASPDAARELLENLRWPDDPVCPHCGHNAAYALKAKSTSKRPVRQGVYKCKGCRKQFTVTVGTIFEGSHIPLNKWLMAIHLMCASKKRISAHQLHRMLDITYKSTWFMCHRIRYAMTQPPLVDKLTGIVEADEAYVGGKTRGGKRGRGAEKKVPVAILVERNGRARVKKVTRVDGQTLKGNIRSNVDKNARIMTDELRSYRGLDKEFADHQTVTHSIGEYVRGDVHTNTAESFIALMKRAIHGTFHHVSKKHLDRYLNEFAFRWGERGVSDSERTVAALTGIQGKRLYYGQPTTRE